MSRADVHPREWLLLALRGLTASRTPPTLMAENPDARIIPLRRRPRALLEPPGLGRHSNRTPEICVALMGSAVMTMQDRYYDFSPPMLAIVGEGVLHSEAVASRTRAYSLLWMSVSKSSVYLVVSRHTPRRGWDNPFRHAFYDSSVIGLDRAVRAPASPHYLEKVSAELISVLAAIHRDVALNGSSRTEEGQRLAMLQHLQDYLEAHLDQPISLQQIAAMTKLAPNYLNSLFRQWKGCGIHSYLIQRRMEKALELGCKPGIAVKEIAAAVGYPDALYFSRAFHRHHGFWPSDLKQRLARS